MGQVADSINRNAEITQRGFGMVSQAVDNYGQGMLNRAKMQEEQRIYEEKKATDAVQYEDLKKQRETESKQKERQIAISERSADISERLAKVQEGELAIKQQAQDLAREKTYLELFTKGEKGKSDLASATADGAMTAMNGFYDMYMGYNKELASSNKDLATIPILAPDEFTKMQKAYKDQLVAALGEDKAAEQLKKETTLGIQVMQDAQEHLAKGTLQRATPEAVIQKFDTLKAQFPAESPVRAALDSMKTQILAEGAYIRGEDKSGWGRAWQGPNRIDDKRLKNTRKSHIIAPQSF